MDTTEEIELPPDTTRTPFDPFPEEDTGIDRVILEEPEKEPGDVARRIDEHLGPSLVQGPHARTKDLAVSRWRTDDAAAFPCRQEDELLVHVAFQPLEIERHAEGKVDRGVMDPGEVTLAVPGPEVWHLGEPPAETNDFAQLAIPHDALERHLEEREIAAPVVVPSVLIARVPAIERVAYETLRAAERDDFDPGEHAEDLLDALVASFGAPDSGAAGRARLCTAQLRRVEELVEARLREPLALADLAAAVGLSRFHFLRAFRNAAGVTPGAFVLARRVERAQRLLATTAMPIAAIAAATGFADHGHLTRSFRRRFGLTPSAYRALVRGSEARVA